LRPGLENGWSRRGEIVTLLISFFPYFQSDAQVFETWLIRKHFNTIRPSLRHVLERFAGHDPALVTKGRVMFYALLFALASACCLYYVSYDI
jgi:hypothetical protein